MGTVAGPYRPPTNGKSFASSFWPVERIPHPPPCGHCGQSVGVWEPILAAPGFDEATTWLALSEKLDQLPELIHHLVCPGDEED